jgi:hypothetical protein
MSNLLYIAFYTIIHSKKKAVSSLNNAIVLLS